MANVLCGKISISVVDVSGKNPLLRCLETCGGIIKYKRKIQYLSSWL